jgi:hypothetical protein
VDDPVVLAVSVIVVPDTEAVTYAEESALIAVESADATVEEVLLLP